MVMPCRSDVVLREISNILDPGLRVYDLSALLGIHQELEVSFSHNVCGCFLVLSGQMQFSAEGVYDEDVLNKSK